MELKDKREPNGKECEKWKSVLHWACIYSHLSKVSGLYPEGCTPGFRDLFTGR